MSVNTTKNQYNLKKIQHSSWSFSEHKGAIALIPFNLAFSKYWQALLIVKKVQIPNFKKPILANILV